MLLAVRVEDFRFWWPYTMINTEI